MIHAFSYYLTCTARNMALTRLRRLRQPKYLISALVGAAYLYYFFLGQFFRHGSGHGSFPRAIPADLMPAAEVGFSVILLAAVLLPWLWPGGGKAILFTEAEIQFLFPAPVSRRSLLRFRILKGQLGILFGVLISTFIFGRGSLFPRTGFLLVGLWLVYSFLSLYYTAASLSKASLFEHGVSGLRRQAWVLALLALTVVSIVAWLRWFIPAPPPIGRTDLEQTLRWIAATAASGPAYYLLMPFKALVKPAFSQDLLTFLLHLPFALAVLAAVYFWIIQSDASFAEAALERAEKSATRLKVARSGRLPVAPSRTGRVRRPPFLLATDGPPAVAILWKNLASGGRIQLRILVLVIVAFLIVIGVAYVDREGRIAVVPLVVGGTTAVMACMLSILGPIMVRDDLRADLLNIDLIKTYPLSGREVVAAEILAPAGILALSQWALILIAATTLPNLEKMRLLLAHRAAFGLAAAILLPCISLIGLIMQNLAALLFPAWMQLGKALQRGIEATGQRLITTVLSAITLLLAAIPAAIAFVAAFFSAYWLVGLAAIPIAATAAASVLLVEAGIGIFFMGRLFDRFDPSHELDSLETGSDQST